MTLAEQPVSRRATISPAELRGLSVRHAGPASAILAAAWWLVEVTRSWAGWDSPSVTVGAILIAVAVILTRPDRVLPAKVVGLALAISAGAFIVALTAPSGWAGANVAAIYASGAWLAVVVAATVARGADLSLWFVSLVVGSAPIEFVSGWLGWWGGGDPSRPMVGTFYWHNPYAAFLLPGGLLGLAFWVWRDRLFAVLGLAAFTLASVGIVYSTSRASLACFALGVVVLAAIALLDVQRLRSLRQLVVAAVVAGGAAYLVGGPPFFSHRASPLAGEQARTATQSLGQNGGYRIDFWREALTVFKHHPITGGGYKSLVAESAPHVPKSWPLSPFAHNGYLQALSDGGLVLAVPFLIAVVGVAYVCIRAIIRGLLSRRVSVEGFAVPVALGCVLLHAGVDFDWAYPADFAMAAVLVGLVVGRHLAGRSAPADGMRVRPMVAVGLACVLAGVALLGLSAWTIRHGDHGLNLPTSASPNLP